MIFLMFNREIPLCMWEALGMNLSDPPTMESWRDYRFPKWLLKWADRA
jgi:hypothetical protein